MMQNDMSIAPAVAIVTPVIASEVPPVPPTVVPLKTAVTSNGVTESTPR